MIGEDTTITVGAAFAAASAIALIWWRFQARVRDVEKDLSDHKVEVARNYATRGNLTEEMSRLNEQILALRGEVRDGLKSLGDRFEGWLQNLNRTP